MINDTFTSSLSPSKASSMKTAGNGPCEYFHGASEALHQWRLVLLIGIMFCLYATPSVSQPVTHQIKLSAHEFEAWNFTPKPDDQIVITNHSEISHSIYITYSDGTVENLGVQTPGEKVSWTVPESGEYILQCWIHPVIKASLTVANSASVS